jgi:N-acyl homoserine lactone hydrolase
VRDSIGLVLVCGILGDVPGIEVHRVDFGCFVRPGSETATGQPRVEPCLGYVVRHPDGPLLFDTGMGSHPDVDAHYQPRRVPLANAPAAVGVALDDVSLVTNCHLHFDHCGGNPQLAGHPVLVQSAELQDATTTTDYTIPDLLEGSRFEAVDGETEVWDGVRLVPTPGHTSGHQSLVVHRSDGVVIVAGQSHDTASEYAADALARKAHHAGGHAVLPRSPAWMDRLQNLDPRAVYFAHDNSVWKP